MLPSRFGDNAVDAGDSVIMIDEVDAPPRYARRPVMAEETTAETTSSDVKEPKESMWSLQNVMLFISVTAIGIAILLMLLELSSYHFDFGANTVR